MLCQRLRVFLPGPESLVRRKQPMTFETFKDHLQDERVELYNYFRNHIWDNDYTKLFIYTLPGKNDKRPELTRKARHGAHFVLTRFCDFGENGVHVHYESKCSIYVTKHTEYFKDVKCFVIRQDVLDTLTKDDTYPAYVLFETDDSFAAVVKAKDLLTAPTAYQTRNQQGVYKHYFPVSDFPLFAKDSTEPAEDISFFQPTFLGHFTFHFTVHGYASNVKVYRSGVLLHQQHFDTITDFFNAFNLSEKGAKLKSIQQMFAKSQNFTFKDLTFVFDESWETVTYKTRMSKRQKDLVKEIEAKKLELSKEEPEEEEIITPYVESVVEEPVEPQIIIRPDVSPKTVNGWSTVPEDADSVNLWDLPY